MFLAVSSSIAMSAGSNGAVKTCFQLASSTCAHRSKFLIYPRSAASPSVRTALMMGWTLPIMSCEDASGRCSSASRPFLSVPFKLNLSGTIFPSEGAAPLTRVGSGFSTCAAGSGFVVACVPFTIASCLSDAPFCPFVFAGAGAACSSSFTNGALAFPGRRVTLPARLSRTADTSERLTPLARQRTSAKYSRSAASDAISSRVSARHSSSASSRIFAFSIFGSESSRAVYEPEGAEAMRDRTVSSRAGRPDECPKHDDERRVLLE